MKFTETSLEASIRDLILNLNIPCCNGYQLNNKVDEILLENDLKKYLTNKYKSYDITMGEMNYILNILKKYNSFDLYESNKSILNIVANGLVLKREDRSKKDLYISHS